MTSPGAYAIDTKVPVSKTRDEIEALIRKHGGERFAYSDQVKSAIIAFSLEGRLIRMTLPLPHVHTGLTVARSQRMTRSSWRALLLILKGKLEAIARGIVTVEHEFMADTVIPGGQTVAEWAGPQIQQALSSGEPPMLLVAYQKGDH